MQFIRSMALFFLRYGFARRFVSLLAFSLLFSIPLSSSFIVFGVLRLHSWGFGSHTIVGRWLFCMETINMIFDISFFTSYIWFSVCINLSVYYSSYVQVPPKTEVVVCYMLDCLL